ncbi:hypothetical protein [Nitratidesulfovibrio sp. 1201_IL3209]|uniref:hypothetical protein n=1 Tax=Nitratidesulfovibrio sp. 1201_IL3209 TaxID=3084053 RepID=UPI002FD89B68
MNTDFRVSVDFFAHHKARKLRRRLGADALLSLLQLWAYAAKMRADGSLAGMDSEDVELAAGWDGDAGLFTKALVEVGFIDLCDDGMALHDWAENNPWVADEKSRKERAQKGAAARWAKHPECSSNAQAMPKHAFSNAPLPSPSPEETSLNSEVLPKAEAVSSSTRSASAPSKPGAARTKKPAEPASPETGYRTRKGRTLDGKRLDAFERFWSAYGYAKGKAEAADAWLDIPQLTESLVAQIVAAAQREAAARPALLASGRTPKMAQGWITARRWEDGEEPVPRAMSAARDGPPMPRTYRELQDYQRRVNASKIDVSGFLAEVEPGNGKQTSDLGNSANHAGNLLSLDG